jgi:hypothetical protein
MVLGTMTVEAQRKGQSAKIQHGVVVGMDQVDLNDSKATQGALLGGAIAYGSSSGKSGYKKRRNAAIGALVGAAAGSSPRQKGMMYTVEVVGGAIKVVTDQTEIHMGDCVVVEETAQGANIRRVDAQVCDPAASAVVDSLAEEFQEEAAECAAAKAEVAAAKTNEELEIALRKMEILCNG